MASWHEAAELRITKVRHLLERARAKGRRVRAQAKTTRVRAGSDMGSPVVADLPLGTRVYAYGRAVCAGVSRVEVALAERRPPRGGWGAVRGWVSEKQLRKAAADVRVGLCFLVYEAPAHQDLWRAFLPRDESRFRVLVHSKTPATARVDLPTARVLERPVETEWASIALVEATHMLFRAARDDGCDVFVLLSDTMLPLVPFDELCRRVTSTTFQLQTTPSEKEARDHRGNYDHHVRPKLPRTVRFEPQEIRKGNMFCAVARDDFEAIERRAYLDVFEKIWGGAPDEYYWINCMTIHRRPYDAPGTFIYCSPDTTGVTAAETFVLDDALLEETTRLGFTFIRKVTAVTAKAAYLQAIT